MPRLKVTDMRQVNDSWWARFLKVFAVPESFDTYTIHAKLNVESARVRGHERE